MRERGGGGLRRLDRAVRDPRPRPIGTGQARSSRPDFDPAGSSLPIRPGYQPVRDPPGGSGHSARCAKRVVLVGGMTMGRGGGEGEQERARLRLQRREGSGGN